MLSSISISGFAARMRMSCSFCLYWADGEYGCFSKVLIDLPLVCLSLISSFANSSIFWSTKKFWILVIWMTSRCFNFWFSSAIVLKVKDYLLMPFYLCWLNTLKSTFHMCKASFCMRFLKSFKIMFFVILRSIAASMLYFPWFIYSSIWIHMS